jgi:hypothetical protein
MWCDVPCHSVVNANEYSILVVIYLFSLIVPQLLDCLEVVPFVIALGC